MQRFAVKPCEKVFTNINVFLEKYSKNNKKIDTKRLLTHDLYLDIDLMDIDLMDIYFISGMF